MTKIVDMNVKKTVGILVTKLQEKSLADHSTSYSLIAQEFGESNGFTRRKCLGKDRKNLPGRIQTDTKAYLFG